jgi:hypothetical protein
LIGPTSAWNSQTHRIAEAAIGVSVGRKKIVRKSVVPRRRRLSSTARPSDPSIPSGTTSAAK